MAGWLLVGLVTRVNCGQMARQIEMSLDMAHNGLNRSQTVLEMARNVHEIGGCVVCIPFDF